MSVRPRHLCRLVTGLACLAAKPRLPTRPVARQCPTRSTTPAFSTLSLSLLETSSTRIPAAAALLAGVGAGLVWLAGALPQATDTQGDGAPGALAHDARDPSIPRYRLSEVRTHDASHPNPWVTYQDRVYDITDWVSAHPGGDVILRAAGQSIDPYWAIFTVHNQQHVSEILEQYLIGYVHESDLVGGLPPAHSVQDPFTLDPARDPRLLTHTAKPCNAEPPNHSLTETFLTSNALFYTRNHMWVPAVEDAHLDQHTLTVELPSGDTRSYTLQDLKTRFTTHRVTAVLQCSGNRRSDMTRHAAKTNGLQWGVGAIGNAEWQGVRLADVLADAGLVVGGPNADDHSLPDPGNYHVQLTGLEAYGASIPLYTALDPRNDVILAFAMNGQPLPRDHGSPLRAVVPGHVAARSVKWLSKIVIADEESPSQW
jgi:sulfite oxidase